jgi:hypothetical protein
MLSIAELIILHSNMSDDLIRRKCKLLCTSSVGTWFYFKDKSFIFFDELGFVSIVGESDV